MILPLVATLFAAGITRDDYGVPHIQAAAWGEAFELAGYAVAEDRLWQMENSRLLSRAKLSKVFGKSFEASDRDVLKSCYTDAELQDQVDKLPPKIKEAFEAYARGVSKFIAEGKLPPGYAQNGFKPEPWSVIDTAAISVRFLQTFGRGGAGEIRNMALYGYMQSQKGIKGRELDVLDDFAWQNDARARTTVTPGDDPLAKNHPVFHAPTRAETEKHLALLPKANLLELLPGIRVAERQDSTRVAELVGSPYKSGSYCVVVGPSRSANGKAILLSGPQMGFRSPSIAHEMSIDAPGIHAVGMDVPGVPGIMIGHTSFMAWGLTTGVADTEDVMFAKQTAEGYQYGSQTKPLQTLKLSFTTKEGVETPVDQMRTEFGPVALRLSSGFIFARKSSFWKRELESFSAVYDLYAAKSVGEIKSAIEKATMNFNFFYATVGGDIGYHYAGNVPMRAPGLDPRFPTPLSPETDWKGFLPKAQMPGVDNPKSGILFNWNNKPATWWPNWDTPVWGRIFRNEVLAQQLTKPKLTVSDVEMAPWQVARTDYNWWAFKDILKESGDEWLTNFDGRLQEGSIGAGLYVTFFDALREELFTPHIGGLISPDNFRQAVQPSVMLNALEGKTKFNYLAGRQRSAVLRAALAKTIQRRGDDPEKWRFSASRMNISDPSVPYSDRGTYIQIVEMLSKPTGRNVLPPGVAEFGPHSQDQSPLSRAWIYKPMGFGG